MIFISHYRLHKIKLAFDGLYEIILT